MAKQFFNKKIMSVSELAWYLGVSTSLIYKKARSGDIPCFKLGRKILFNIDKVEKALQCTK